MPKLSPTMESGAIVKWHKCEGDFIEVGDPLLDIATDKAVLSHSSTEEGWLGLIIKKDRETVPVGCTIAVLTSEKEEVVNPEDVITSVIKEVISSEPKYPNQEDKDSNKNFERTYIKQAGFSPEPPLTKLPVRRKSNKVSPLARKLASLNNLDLSTVCGTGPGGRIMKKDIDYAPKKGLVSFGCDHNECSDLPGSFEESKLSPIRSTIAARLQASKSYIPHFYVTQRVNVSALIEAKNQLENLGCKFSINDLLTRACSLTLKAFPCVNSGFNSVENKIIKFKTIDISFAVAIPEGLITPIIRCADKKNLEEIREETKKLVTKARNNSLKEEEYKGGSFCISNLGMTGISEFTAIINPPQTAILAVGGTETRPLVYNGTIVIGQEMTLTLSVDHRVIDGMKAALFLKHLQKLLENPIGLLIS